MIRRLPPRPGGSLAAFVLVAAACGAYAAAYASPGGDAGKRWWAHVRFLADDKLEGRLTGTRGYRAAAAYVVDRFKEYGLEPAGVEGYLQPVRFDVQRVIAGKSSLALVRDGKVEPLALGSDALLSSRNPQPAVVEAPLVFVGYALHLPEAGYDDLAGLDLAGKVLVYIYGGPKEISGNLQAHARSSRELARTFERAGAIGAIGMLNPKAMDLPWERMALSASQPGMRLAEAALQDTDKPFFAATFNAATAEKLFAGSGHTIAELLALADAVKPLPRFPLPAAVRAKVVTRTEHVEAPNVAGILRGGDPALRDQVVVLSAHLDHLGIGEAIAGDRIYHGAMDNASGVASILEIARALHQAAEHGQRPRRSIMFLAVCAEEKGLLGSRYFAAHPTVPPHQLVADLNIDMFLPIHPLHFLTVEGLEESSLGDDAKTVGTAAGIEVVPDRFPDENSFVRSDQYSFIRQGVPALAFSFGQAPGSPEEREVRVWLGRHYHAPSDDVNQPVDLAAAAQFNQIILDLAKRVADEPARPAFKKESFFRRFAQPAPPGT
jgi:Zn-dependent M28 family amino/carboxypeptidase